MPVEGDIANTPSGGLPPALLTLISVFEKDIDRYRSDTFKEMSVRSDFINPLLEALGWDPLNKQGSRYSQREVIQEDSVTIDGSQKAPDYALQIEGTRKFFLEAKRPQVNIGGGRSAAYQIRRYCWSAGLPFGLLTDFEEYAVYDCRTAPDPQDSAQTARIAYFSYKELPEWWDWLNSLFGRDSVASGALDRLAASRTVPRGTQPIDVAFLEEIRNWRRNLAADIAWRNQELDVVDVNFVVQQTIDRLIFLRIAEARGLEPSENLYHAVRKSTDVYASLTDIFLRADDRYNSGLFHFHETTDVRSDVDGLSLETAVGNHVLKRIVDRMYYPQPYEFSVMPADILGRIYEQFLGEVIEVREDRSIDLALKPEVRRAGGVYYTPQPIVEFIVSETVGPLLSGRTPQQVARMRVVDPACGSGSFLISVFQHLIDWHRAYYSTRPRLAERYLETSADGQIRLRTTERKRILQNNVYGVDIDPQAVEVTKLSLLLKVIEGQNQLELDVGRILPDLENNILCGNSLIESDFEAPTDADREDLILRFNPFDWSEGFPETMEAGGFDAVVGNPPYLNIDAVWGRHDPRLAYLKSAYSEIYTDKTDILFYFLRRSVQISRGEIGFIVSRSFLEAAKAQKLRGWLGNHARVRQVLDMRHAMVFPKVGINTAIVRLSHSRAIRESTFSRYEAQQLPPGYDANTLRDPAYVSNLPVEPRRLDSSSWLFGSADVEAVKAKIDAAGEPIGDILWVGKGMEAGRNKAFYFDASPERMKELRAEGLLYTRARNSDIGRYTIASSGVNLLYLEDVRRYNDLPSDVRQHLKDHEEELKKRAAYKRGNCDWWRFTWPLHREHFSRSRIWCPYRAEYNRFGLDLDLRWLGLTDTTALYDAEQEEDLEYLVGILNTDILSARFRLIGKLLGGGVVEYYENTVRQLVIPRISSADPRHIEVVGCVREIAKLTALIPTTLLDDEQSLLLREIADQRSKIEEIAANLYGLSSSELETLSDLLLSPEDTAT